MNPVAQVVAWLSVAIATWVPNLDVSVRGRAAAEVVSVAYDPSEPPVFAGAQGRAKTAILIAVVASEESGFRTDVQAGHCRPGECDHGRASCWMQLHAGSGIVLVGETWRMAARAERGVNVFKRADLVGEENEVSCLRVGVHMIRSSLAAYGSLRGYTGERGRKAPVAEARMRAVRRFVDSNPAPWDDYEIMMGDEF
jgi:hypothetical protein